MSAEELVHACLDRISAREDEVRAFECLDPGYALDQARNLDNGPRLGPLHGVPIGIKDTYDTADMTTAYGSPIYEGNRPRADASAVALCRAAGAVIVGKTVTTEFAYWSPGKTRNPRNLDHTPGGSSSGSAAVVADNMLPLAFGSQTAASVIRPAAFCGVFGYKATRGGIDSRGLLPLAPTRDSSRARSVTSILCVPCSSAMTRIPRLGPTIRRPGSASCGPCIGTRPILPAVTSWRIQRTVSPVRVPRSRSR